MKILLFHPDVAVRQTIRHQIECLDHVVMHEDDSVQNIMLHVAKHQPHVIVVAEFDPVLRIQIETVFDQFALRIPLIWLPVALIGFELEVLIQGEISKIASVPLTPALVPYSDGTRQIIRDIAYLELEDGRKQNFPPASDNESEELTGEIGIFARQVECATRNHAAARHYLRQVLLTDKGLRTEIAYRAVHSSHKIFWERDHIYRWVGVLAHYLPGVEPAYLPPPVPPSTRLDFLGHSSNASCRYASAALQLHGFKPSWMPALQSVLERKFTGQNEQELLQETLILSGWSALMREIAQAHVRVMSCALDPTSPWYMDGLPPRALHRATQIFCDFFNLRRLRENPQQLRLVADAVIAGKIKLMAPISVVPPFRHFVQALKTKTS
jgi:hypothetical protein